MFDGLQHIWRTTDNGGDRAYLDQHCNEISGDFDAPCGDWGRWAATVAGDLSGGDPGNYVVAVERAASNSGTLWAGTRLGRIYVSTNANAANPATVKYKRYDVKLGLPHAVPVRHLGRPEPTRTTPSSPTPATRRTRPAATCTR